MVDQKTLVTFTNNILPAVKDLSLDSNPQFTTFSGNTLNILTNLVLDQNVQYINNNVMPLLTTFNLNSYPQLV